VYGIRKRKKVSNKFVWGMADYDAIEDRWVHIEGLPGVPNYLFPDKKSIVKYINEKNGR
jgi:hypothetical protein